MEKTMDQTVTGLVTEAGHGGHGVDVAFPCQVHWRCLLMQALL